MGARDAWAGDMGGGVVGDSQAWDKGVIAVKFGDNAPEPVFLAAFLDAQLLLDMDEGGVANEEF